MVECIFVLIYRGYRCFLLGEFYEFVKVVGVPGAVAFYVLVRLDRRLRVLVEEVRGLRWVVHELVRFLEKNGRN